MSSKTITLGMMATDSTLLAELLTAMLPEGWRLMTSGVGDGPDRRAMLAEASYLLMAGGSLTRDMVAQAPNLRMVQKAGVGFDGVDFDALKERGILFANTPVDSASLAVAEHAVALAVASLKNIPLTDHAVRVEREWPRWEPRRRIRQIGAQTVGIVGFGRIARHAARLFLGLGCTVIVWARRRPEDFEAFAAENHAEGRISFQPDLDALFRDSTVVSLHVALNEETRGLANRRRLDLLGPKGLIVNTARGPVIDEPELTAALKEGRIGAAALDVLAQEPPPKDLDLLSMPNLIVTPHCATGGTDVQEEKLSYGLENMIAHSQGREIKSRIG